MKKILIVGGELAKAHVSSYTTKNGTFVAEHDDKRAAAKPKAQAGDKASIPHGHAGAYFPAHRQRIAEMKHGDSIKIKAGEDEHTLTRDGDNVHIARKKPAPAPRAAAPAFKSQADARRKIAEGGAAKVGALIVHHDDDLRHSAVAHRTADVASAESAAGKFSAHLESHGFVKGESSTKGGMTETHYRHPSGAHASVKHGDRMYSNPAGNMKPGAGMEINGVKGDKNAAWDSGSAAPAKKAAYGAGYDDHAKGEENGPNPAAKARFDKNAGKAPAFDHPNVVAENVRMTSSHYEPGKGSKEKDAEDPADADTVHFAGKRYSWTSKTGKSNHDGTPVRAYEHEDSGHRVWVDDKRRVHADSTDEVESLRKQHADHEAKQAAPAKKVVVRKEANLPNDVKKQISDIASSDAKPEHKKAAIDAIVAPHLKDGGKKPSTWQEAQEHAFKAGAKFKSNVAVFNSAENAHSRASRSAGSKGGAFVMKHPDHNFHVVVNGADSKRMEKNGYQHVSPSGR